jgi:hypothetical protein
VQTFQPNQGPPLTPRSLTAAKSDHSYCTSPRTAAEKLSVKGRNLQRELDATAKKYKRKENQLCTIKVKLAESKEMGKKRLGRLQEQFPGILKELIDSSEKMSDCKGKTGIRYSEEMKKFAVTLHFYSPRAYDFIRDYLTLPHPTSLTSWMRSANCEPGFQLDVLEQLRSVISTESGKMYKDVVLQVDEMAIRMGPKQAPIHWVCGLWCG